MKSDGINKPSVYQPSDRNQLSNKPAASANNAMDLPAMININQKRYIWILTNNTANTRNTVKIIKITIAVLDPYLLTSSNSYHTGEYQTLR